MDESTDKPTNEPTEESTVQVSETEDLSAEPPPIIDPPPPPSVEEGELTHFEPIRPSWWNRRRLIVAFTALCAVIGTFTLMRFNHSPPTPTALQPPAPILPTPLPTITVPKPVADPSVDELRALIATLSNQPLAPQAAAPAKVPVRVSIPVPAPEKKIAAKPAPPAAPAAPAAVPESTEFFIGSSGLPEWKGTQSRIRQFRTVIVRTPEEWKAFWRDNLGSKPPVPQGFDFEGYIVVGVFAGEKPPGSSIEIMDTEETLPASLLVYYRESHSPGAASSPATVAPYHLWVIQWTSLNIEFKSQ